ncbi:MAG: hypothetical protein PHQ90_09850 [Sulfuricurvum sp.]|uniref:hypothetical protein n=1 Tax=Sulfuricurvum sp. TaxID=2025608 RepID=UPI00261D7570|nr:hypothetical protein [Sulfuricurvum sp.]MDD2369593.1 hypothetical protein [Sulfuricurvum sp.]MDD5119045.1 hypothetical protein [Sulfuricurvum sp.]
MFNRLLMGAAALSLAASMAFGATGAKYYVGDGDKEKVFMSLVNEKINTIGYVLSDPHERINDAYKTKWGTEFKTEKGVQVKHPDFDPTFKETLDNLGFFSITNDKVVGPLLMKEPALGGFSPFNLGIYKKMGEDKTYVGHVDPETMLNITGVKDADVRAKFIASFVPLDKMVGEEIGSKVQTVEYKALPEKPMMTFEVSFDREASLDAFISDFQGKFEEAFEKNHYIIAGYKDFKGAMTDNNIEFGRFDAYWVYSLCHFRFSEGIFNNGRPDAGIFAPCSMYMYVEKGSNKLMIGMPKLENWIAVMGIKDPKMVDSIHKLDKEITGIMIGLGAKEL